MQEKKKESIHISIFCVNFIYKKSYPHSITQNATILILMSILQKLCNFVSFIVYMVGRWQWEFIDIPRDNHV